MADRKRTIDATVCGVRKSARLIEVEEREIAARIAARNATRNAAEAVMNEVDEEVSELEKETINAQKFADYYNQAELMRLIYWSMRNVVRNTDESKLGKYKSHATNLLNDQSEIGRHFTKMNTLLTYYEYFFAGDCEARTHVVVPFLRDSIADLKRLHALTRQFSKKLGPCFGLYKSLLKNSDLTKHAITGVSVTDLGLEGIAEDAEDALAALFNGLGTTKGGARRRVTKKNSFSKKSAPTSGKPKATTTTKKATSSKPKSKAASAKKATTTTVKPKAASAKKATTTTVTPKAASAKKATTTTVKPKAASKTAAVPKKWSDGKKKGKKVMA